MASTKCYNWNSKANSVSIASPEYDQPCPSGGGCCAPGDTCVGTFMCKHKEKATNPNRPDYYIGACTDPTYSSSACVKWCSEFIRTGVIWNSTSDRWACCGTANPPKNLTTTCATPSDVTFALVAPESLPIIGIAGGPVLSSSASTSASASSTASSNSDATSTNTSIDSGPNGGLSTGAKAGLGVGVAVAVAVIGALLVFFLVRRRQRRRSEGSSLFRPVKTQATGSYSHFATSKRDKPSSYPCQQSNEYQIRQSSIDRNVHEIDGDDVRHTELPTNRATRRAELP